MVIGIDMGSGSVKAVVLRAHRDRWRVVGLGLVAIPSGKDLSPIADTAAIARAIRLALERARAPHRAPVMFGLPQHAVALHWQRLAGQPTPQLAQAAVLEAVRLLPFPPSDVVADTILRPDAEGKGTIALVACAPRGVVETYRTAIATAGVPLQGLCVSSLAAAAVANEADEPWLLLDIGAGATAMNVVEHGVVRTGRTVMFGGNRLTQALALDLGCDEETAEARKQADGIAAEGPLGPAVAEWLSQMVAEIRLLLAAHAARGGLPPVRLRLCGGGGALTGLAARLEEALGLPVEPLHLEPLLEAGAPNPLQWVGAYGLAAVAGGLVQTPNLLAVQVQQARAARKRRIRNWVAGLACVVLLFCAVVFGYDAWRIHKETLRHQAAVAREAASARSIAASLQSRHKTLSEHVQSLRAALSPQYAWIDVLNDLATRAPNGVWLTGIEMERGKPLIVRGTAMRPDQVAHFVSSLAQSPLLREARLMFANDAELGRQRVTQFGITALVLGNLPEVKAPTRTIRRPSKTATPPSGGGVE